MNTLSRILMLVNITKGLQFEYDNDIHKGRLTITRYVGLNDAGNMIWESKYFSDTEPLECDGNLNAGLAYVQMLAGHPANDYNGMDLNEIHYLETNKHAS